MVLRRRVVCGAVIMAVLAVVVHNHLVPFQTQFFGLTENNYDLDTYRAAVHRDAKSRLAQEPGSR